MTDLILHIGLGKSGSSTLQRDVFRNEAGYLGTAPGLDGMPNFAKMLQRCAPFGGRQTLNKRALRTWAQLVLEHQSRHWPGIDRLILSNEVLSTASRLSNRPILGVLRTLQDVHWPGRIRVVLVLRNQVERIASSYAQKSAINPVADQANFEEYVARIMNSRRRRRRFDYASYVQSLTEIVGSENLCVLHIEEMGLARFWEALHEFCQLEGFDPAQISSLGSGRKNQRSLSGTKWKISPFDPKKAARDRVAKWQNLSWPVKLAPSLRVSVASSAADLLEKRLRRHDARRVGEERPASIELTKSVRRQIEKQCGDSNSRLGLLLGKDLAALAYPMPRIR